VLALLLAMTVALECRLEAAPATGGERAPVRFVLRNAGSAPVAVLDWHTPLEGLLGPIFEVRGEGRVLDYTGPMVKRGDPEADEYVVLGPGESAAETVDLALAWDLQKAGRYEIRFPGPLRDVTAPGTVPRPRDKHRPHPLSCGPLLLDVS
jgi:peptidyl-Lys metalloendopeptidase